MLSIRKKIVILLSAICLSASVSSNATEIDKYPEKTIKLICSHSPGGDTDYNAQLLAFYLSDLLKVAVEVQNISGNNGTTALTKLKSSEPDGYTLLATNTAALTCSEATGISNYSYLDFEPVAIYGRQCGENIVVLSSSRYKTLDDLLKAANQRPNKLKIGVSMGSSSFISSIILSKEKNAHFRMVDVGGDAEGRVGSLLNKYTDVTIVPYALVKEAIQEGKVRSLATLMSKRLAATPDIPTVEESGVPNLTIDTLYLIMAPKGTPKELVEKLNSKIMELVQKNEDYQAAVGDYNQQEPYVLSVQETIETLMKQRKHVMGYAKFLN